MKQEANANMSQKQRKRKRETPETPRKRSKVAEVKASQKGDGRLIKRLGHSIVYSIRLQVCPYMDYRFQY